jgi:hypothetical protein
MDDLALAEEQRSHGVQKQTKEKEARTWQRWQLYLERIGNSHDPFLQQLDPLMRTRLFGAFAAALRQCFFSKKDNSVLGGGSVEETLAKLGQIFRSNVGFNPYYGPDGHAVHPLLLRQIKGMKNTDPSPTPQKALPVSVYREVHRQAKRSSADALLASTTADLLTIAFFWCMRSCEYSLVTGERRTKLLCFRNIRLFDKLNRPIPIHSPKITEAESVSITFEFQKKEVRDDTISHQRSGDKIDGGHMCPVKACISLIRRAQSFPISQNKLLDTPINTIFLSNSAYQIPSVVFLDTIRRTVKNLGKETLGFGPEEVGTHSNRSGGAMSMFLSGTPVYTIMLMGRWSSDAFMRYIRKQVLAASHGISQKMLTFEDFFTVPDFVHNAADGDLRTRNRNNLASNTSFNGTHASMRLGAHPAFHLEH